MDIIFSHKYTEHYRQYSILYCGSEVVGVFKMQKLFHTILKQTETIPAVSITCHFNKYLIVSIFLYFVSSCLCQPQRAVYSILFFSVSTFYQILHKLFLSKPSRTILYLFQIFQRAIFHFFSNKVLTDIDVAVYFKLGCSQQFNTRDICCSDN